MANIPLKTLTFPGLNDTYTIPQIDTTLAVSGKAADAKATGDAISDVVEDVTAIEQTLPSIENVSLASFATDTASGAIATFPDGADSVPVKALTVEIEPVQDLHGYDAPWPEGGGKNLLKITTSSATGSGITRTVYEDGTIKLDGTATALYVPTIGFIDPGTYILNGCPQGGGESTYRIDVRKDSDGTTQAVDYGSGSSSFTITEPCHVCIRVPNGATVSNVVFKPMVRLASESDATFAPYSNICPITGWSQAKVTRTGKNLLDPNILTVFGATYVSSIDYATEGKVPVKPSMQYVLSFSGSVGDGRILQYDASGNLIGNAISFTSQPYYFTTDARCVSIGFRYKFTETSGATVADSKAQMELGSTASDYEPYQGHTYTIDLSGTRYGGTLDVGTGVLTVDTVGKVFNGTEEWGVTGYVAYTAFPDGFVQQTSSDNSKSSHFVISGSSVNNESAVGKYDEFGSLRFNRTINGSLLDLDGWKSYLSTQNTNGTPVTVINKLATPQTVQLTAEEVTTLLGQNCIFADCGDVAVEYRADVKLYIDKLLNA